MNVLAPSILSANFSALGEDVRIVDRAGADYLHIDVMDGDFVPSISFGMPVIKSIRNVTDKIFDVHLMVTNPERYIDDFVRCGADIVTIHAEACKHLDRTIMQIKEKGIRAGVALNPSTPLSCLEYVIDKVDMVLLMSVNPGFGGQKYIPSSTRKIRELKKMIQKGNLDTDIEVDGGITIQNVSEVLDAGGNVIVAGSSVFNGDIEGNITDYIKILKTYEGVSII